MKQIKNLAIISLIAFSFLNAQSDTSIVSLWSIDSTIVTDVRYATTNNFTGKILYPTDRVFVRKVVAEALSSAHNYLKKKYNFRIKIFDGYRPLSVQKKMWEIYPDDRYVANPATGSRHNRGAAVDVTIIDSNGIQLDMGTEFDNFTEKAHPSYTNLPEKVLYNRKLLSSTMVKYGFYPITTEWWHFDFKGWKRFSILDVEIK